MHQCLHILDANCKLAVYTKQEGQSFFLGQVMDVINEDEGSVNFLPQCSVKKTTFRLSTSSSDCNQRIHSKFIFDWDFEVTTTNGRIWTVKNIKEIRKRFKVYVRDCAWAFHVSDDMYHYTVYHVFMISAYLVANKKSLNFPHKIHVFNWSYVAMVKNPL